MNRFLNKARIRALPMVCVAAVFAGAAGAVPNTNPVAAKSTAAPVPAATSSEDPVEQAIAERLKFSLIQGEIQWRETDSEKFLAVYRPADDEPPHGGIIINIQAGAVVDSVPVYRILAQSLAAAGWAAVSIQQSLPPSDPEKDESLAQASARLNAAIAYMVGLDIENIVIASDPSGAAVALRCIAEKMPPAIAGFVGLGAWDTVLDGTDIPVLSVVGTRDRKALARQAMRTAKTQKRLRAVEILEIDGAGPKFHGYEDHVAKRIRGWLERTAPGTIVRRPSFAEDK
jgi:pimeloyl-ACP methyl ester carboxylesterase